MIVVLQCACSAATDMTRQNPGDPDHPKSQTKVNHYQLSNCVAISLWASFGSIYPDVAESVKRIGLAHQNSLDRQFFLECHEFGDKLGQRQSAQALGNGIRVSVSLIVSTSLCSIHRTTIHRLFASCASRRPPMAKLLGSGFRARPILISLDYTFLTSYTSPQFSSMLLAGAR